MADKSKIYIKPKAIQMENLKPYACACSPLGSGDGTICGSTGNSAGHDGCCIGNNAGASGCFPGNNGA